MRNKPFVLTKRNYKVYDILRLSWEIAPRQVGLWGLLAVLDGLLPTACMAMGTAFFVDTATAIFKGQEDFKAIYVPLCVLLLVLAAINALQSCYSLVDSRLKQRLKQKLFPAIIRLEAQLDYRYIEDKKAQEMIELTTDEMEETFSDGLGAYEAIAKNVMGLSSMLLLLLGQICWATLLIVAFSLPLLWVAMWAGKRNYAAKVDTRPYERRYSYYSDDVLCSREAVEERTLFGYTDAMADRYYADFKTASRMQLQVLLKTRLATKATSMALIVVTMLTAFSLIQPLLDQELSPGMFMGIISALIGMANGLGGQVQEATKNLAEAKEYMEGLTALVTMATVPGATDLPQRESIDFQQIECRNVSFRYPNTSKNVLKGLTLTLEKGKHYAFVGANGAGKSTLTKLLTGLYPVDEGEILIDGKDIRTFSQAQLKALYSVIYQDFARYEIPLKDALHLGDLAHAYDEEKAARALEKVGLQESLAQGEDMALGKLEEKGRDLSGGEWQKLAIARSLMSPAPIKIMDEPTAALDPLSEDRLYHQFQELMKGKTSIFISHRLGSTRPADEIFVIDQGKLAQRGRHEALMQQEGLYRTMYKEQSGMYQG